MLELIGSTAAFETPVATVGTVWESAADTWTSHVVIATADLCCFWCDWTPVAWQGQHMVGKAGVGYKWIIQKWIGYGTNKYYVIFIIYILILLATESTQTRFPYAMCFIEAVTYHRFCYYLDKWLINL